MDRDVEESRRGIEQRVRDIDATGLETPGDRANRVYQYLKETEEFSNWDVICFCAEYLALISPSMVWIQKPVKQLVRLIYQQHYVLTEQLMQFEGSIKEFKMLDEEVQKEEEEST